MSDKEAIGDFRYNGIPIYKVGFSDFTYIVNCFENDNRILSKQLTHKDLQEHYRKSKSKAFGIFYEGVIVDFRDLKKD